jgi:DNA-binding NarL/FixJ family response regulator
LRKFLVVEDNLGFARCVARLLAKYGKAIHGSTLHEAEAAIATHPHFSAIITDLHLPDGDGLVALRKFRDKFPRQPALVLTGYPDAENINAAYDLGADFVAKPFDGSRIHQFVVSKVLLRHRRPVTGPSGHLTVREQQVIERARQGQDDKTIAHELGIARSSVRWYFASASAKLGALSRRHLLEKVEDLGV